MHTHILGFPRIGKNRELKRALESFWKNEIPEHELLEKSDQIRRENWRIQSDAGLSLITTGDFSLYDHVLDTAVMLGSIPKRFRQSLSESGLKGYFDMARGNAQKDVPAMEMTKWFNTNYHYIVPELSKNLDQGRSNIVEETRKAASLGYNPKPVLLGPITFLTLGHAESESMRWGLLDHILETYIQKIRELSGICEWIQIDEPVLCTDMSSGAKSSAPEAWKALKKSSGDAKLMLATYFGPLEDNLESALDPGFDALHTDMSRPRETERLLQNLPQKTSLSAGVVNGRNIWKTDFKSVCSHLGDIAERIGTERLLIGSSCSLLHCPVDIAGEKQLDPAIKDWMAFAVQKCAEISYLGEAAQGNENEKTNTANQKSVSARRSHPRVKVEKIRKRCRDVDENMLNRTSDFIKRREKQDLRLPLFPTTTIGSFPQTAQIRSNRLKYKKGRLNREEYRHFIKNEIKGIVRKQENIGLDVLVHGEPERNDMVEYFGQNLEGFCFTENGWVQSYGSRCVKPPVIYGDIHREKPITVDWIKYAQSLTSRPIKGMLTGPVTMAGWSFVRDDLPRSEVCKQLALYLRDEIKDLETAGIRIIQVDEAAFREGLPLKRKDWEEYLSWATKIFRLATSGVSDETQVHTHMCYSKFNSIIKWIAEMDADVISIECSRSKMNLLEVFREFRYPNEIGPGVYDIHSSRIPSEEEMYSLLEKALQYIPKENLWINPDCGLKTRDWAEAEASLDNMVKAALRLRKEHAK